MLSLMEFMLIDALNKNRATWNTAGTQPRMGLYTNNRVPTHKDILSQYTEATFPGYARQICTNWTAPAEDAPTGHYNMQADVVRFTCSANVSQQTIYGYFVVLSDGTFAWAEQLWPTPLVVQFSQDQVSVVPVLSTKAEFG